MDLRKLRNGEWIALASGVALIVALFLPWYGVDGKTASGWDTLTVIDVVLLICALFGIGVWAALLQQPTHAFPLSVAAMAVWAGILATTLTLIRVIDSPADGLGLEYGAFVALAASVGLFTGAWRSLGDERIRRPDGSWSEPTEGELGAGVEVKTLRPPRVDSGASESS